MSGTLHSRGSATGSAPLLTPAQAAVLLEQVVYEQVLACMDLDELSHLEQSLIVMVDDIDGIGPGGARPLIGAMLDRALLRLPDDVRSYLRLNEVLLDGCELCEDEARQASLARGSVTATGGDRRSKRPNS